MFFFSLDIPKPQLLCSSTPSKIQLILSIICILLQRTFPIFCVLWKFRKSSRNSTSFCIFPSIIKSESFCFLLVFLSLLFFSSCSFFLISLMTLVRSSWLLWKTLSPTVLRMTSLHLTRPVLISGSCLSLHP